MKRTLRTILCSLSALTFAQTAWTAMPVQALNGDLRSETETDDGVSASRRTADSELATVQLDGAASYNIWKETYSYEKTIPAVLSQTEQGFERIEYINGRIQIDSWNESGELIKSLSLEMALPIFGGIFAGDQYNFIVSGQMNYEENDEKSVIVIEKYDKNWTPAGSKSLHAINTVEPFGAGSLAMTETGGKLYLHTCHKMYKADDGFNHQANMTFVLNQDTLEVMDSYYDVMNLQQAGYVSHSFNQLIATDGESVYRADLGDAYPRGIALTRCNVNGRITSVKAAVPLEIAGTIGDNYTGVTISGMVLTSDSVLISGTCADPETSGKKNDSANVFMIVASRDLSSSEVIWLTDYPAGTDANSTRLVGYSDHGAVLMWAEETEGVSRTRICSLNDQGKLTSDIQTIDAPVSQVRPVLFNDGTVRWYSSNNSAPRLHTLNPDRMDQLGSQRIDMQRLYNPNSGEHFYTADLNEKAFLIELGWQYEGIGWTAPMSSERPIYRLYNPNQGDHHYTGDKNERRALIEFGWKYEGIGWYSANEQGVPLFRQYNPNALTGGSHNYTSNLTERDHLVSVGWHDEGLAWFGLE